MIDIWSERKSPITAVVVTALGMIVIGLTGLRMGLEAWGVAAYVLSSLAFVVLGWQLSLRGIFLAQPNRSVNRKSRRISQAILAAYVGAIATVTALSYPWG